MSVHVIVFSKDRPLQLHGYLSSLFARWHGDFTVDALIQKRPPFAVAYDWLAESFAGDSAVRFWVEDDFPANLTAILDRGRDAPFTMFGVDDAVWVRDVSGATVEGLFAHRPLLGYSLRLGRNIRSNLWAGEVAHPTFRAFEEGLCWDVTAPDSHADWAYPWEVVGTVYPTDYVQAMVKMLVARTLCNSPSQLEHFGNQRWSQHTPHREMAALLVSAVVLPAPNRVQHEHANPLLGPELSTEFLLDCWHRGLRLDHETFGRRANSQIHVPDFFLRRAG